VGAGAHLGVVRAPAKYTRAYDGRADQIRQVRAFLAGVLDGCPVAGDAVLVGDELASNAVRHSNSGKPGGRFTVRVEVHEPDYLWIEVEDEGGPRWKPRSPDGETWHGLNIVGQVTGEGNWGIDGTACGSVVWARLDWPEPQPSSRTNR
jgi:serine/threonine-protein kinase RsbW